MKRDLRSFMKEYKKMAGQPEQGDRSCKPGRQAQAEQGGLPSGENLEQLLKQYSGKSREELMGELQQNINAQKAGGNFSPEALQRFAAMAAPMLTKEQQARMQDIIKQLR